MVLKVVVVLKALELQPRVCLSKRDYRHSMPSLELPAQAQKDSLELLGQIQRHRLGVDQEDFAALQSRLVNLGAVEKGWCLEGLALQSQRAEGIDIPLSPSDPRVGRPLLNVQV